MDKVKSKPKRSPTNPTFFLFFFLNNNPHVFLPSFLLFLWSFESAYFLFKSRTFVWIFEVGLGFQGSPKLFIPQILLIPKVGVWSKRWSGFCLFHAESPKKVPDFTLLRWLVQWRVIFTLMGWIWMRLFLARNPEGFVGFVPLLVLQNQELYPF